MNHYLIDYENVGVDGMNGIEQLDRDNRIYIFYTKNADKLTFDLHIKLIQAKAEVLLFKVESGQKNALDFQLSSYLGYLIRENFDGQNNYFIVSKDNGFTSLFPFWKKQGVKISFVADVAQNKAKSASEDLTPIVADLQSSKAFIVRQERQLRCYNHTLRNSQQKEASYFYNVITTQDSLCALCWSNDDEGFQANGLKVPRRNSIPDSRSSSGAIRTWPSEHVWLRHIQ